MGKSSVLFVLLALGIILLATVVQDGESARYYQQFRDKPRTPRGFKNERLSTARGFGKRDPEFANPEGNVVADSVDDNKNGPAAAILLSKATFPRYAFKGGYNQQSFPVDWLVEQIQTDPELARMFISKFVDINQDGEITADELITPFGIIKANIIDSYQQQQ